MPTAFLFFRNYYCKIGCLLFLKYANILDACLVLTSFEGIMYFCLFFALSYQGCSYLDLASWVPLNPFHSLYTIIHVVLIKSRHFPLS